MVSAVVSVVSGQEFLVLFIVMMVIAVGFALVRRSSGSSGEPPSSAEDS